MPIVNKTYFVLDIQWPKGELSNLDAYIEKYEPEVLESLLGYELSQLVSGGNLQEPYKSLVEGAEYTVKYQGKDVKLKWPGLADTKRSLIAYYVYVMATKYSVTRTQSVGEVKPKTENSNPANVFGKLMSAWTKFEEFYGYEGQSIITPSAYNYLTAKKADFPQWIFTNLLGYINSHDL